MKTIQYDQSFRELLLAAGLGLFLVGGVAAEEATMRFTLKDYLHHRWTHELVSYEVDAAKVPSSVRLAGPGGEVVPARAGQRPRVERNQALVLWRPLGSHRS